MSNRHTESLRNYVLIADAHCNNGFSSTPSLREIAVLWCKRHVVIETYEQIISDSAITLICFLAGECYGDLMCMPMCMTCQCIQVIHSKSVVRTMTTSFQPYSGSCKYTIWSPHCCVPCCRETPEYAAIKTLYKYYMGRHWIVENVTPEKKILHEAQPNANVFSEVVTFYVCYVCLTDMQGGIIGQTGVV